MAQGLGTHACPGWGLSVTCPVWSVLWVVALGLATSWQDSGLSVTLPSTLCGILVCCQAAGVRHSMKESLSVPWVWGAT